MSTTTVNLSITINGVAANVTSATLGVTRNDTSAEVVAPGTAFNHSGTGEYQYTFTDPAYNLIYTVTKTWVYAGQTYSQVDIVPGTTAPASSGMNLASAIAFLRTIARNGQDSSMYTDTMCTNAITGIGNDFLQRTHATRSTINISLTPGTSAYTIATANFRTEYLLRATLLGVPSATTSGDPPSLEVTSFDRVSDLLTNASTSGQPTLIGFDSFTTFSVYPVPNLAFTLGLLWDPPFDASGTLNIPDEYMQSILRWGAVYFLQGNEPENQRAMALAWQNYLDFVKRCQSNGIGTLGKQVEHRVPRRGIPSGGPRRIITDHLYH